jgi:hypothetical protein
LTHIQNRREKMLLHSACNAKGQRTLFAQTNYKIIEYTLTVNTRVNITKNKLPDMFAKKGRFEEADVTTLITEYMPTINTLVNIVTGNIKNKP